jgi:hypothetical protein
MSSLARLQCGKVKQESSSFLKKRTKKLLFRRPGHVSDTPATPRTQTGKSFLVLFFKKERLP